MTSVTVLDGVGPSLEADLTEAGYCSLERVAHANLSVVCEVDEMSPGLVYEAQQYMAENHRWQNKPLARECRQEQFCRYCSKGHSVLSEAPIKVHEKRCSENEAAPERFQK
jgi:hypothetical protein